LFGSALDALQVVEDLAQRAFAAQYGAPRAALILALQRVTHDAHFNLDITT
jgi:hypothetical protein